MKNSLLVTTNLAGSPVDSTLPTLRYQNKRVPRYHGEICWDSHTIKTVINTCIVPGVWVCVTSSFSLWLERNKRTYVLIARAPSPVARGRWSVRRGLSPYPHQLLASPTVNLPGLASDVWAGKLEVFNHKIFPDFSFAICIKTFFKCVCMIRVGWRWGLELGRMKGTNILWPTLLGCRKKKERYQGNLSFARNQSEEWWLSLYLFFFVVNFIILPGLLQVSLFMLLPSLPPVIPSFLFSLFLPLTFSFPHRG